MVCKLPIHSKSYDTMLTFSALTFAYVVSFPSNYLSAYIIYYSGLLGSFPWLANSGVSASPMGAHATCTKLQPLSLYFIICLLSQLSLPSDSKFPEGRDIVLLWKDPQHSAWHVVCKSVHPNLSRTLSSYKLPYISHTETQPLRHSPDMYKICHIHSCPGMLSHCDLSPVAQTLTHSSHAITYTILWQSSSPQSLPHTVFHIITLTICTLKTGYLFSHKWS